MDELRADDPRQVGRYTLLARLGSGGICDAYLGQSTDGPPVVVKVIRGDLAREQSARLRFAWEVEAARRVSGAGTAPVLDADPDAPVPWLVTGYVSGPSLAEAVERHGPLPLASVLSLATGLAAGLAAAHAAGVTHRDLNPANVLLAPDGPRLIDFGLSQAADYPGFTSAEVAAGTPGFMSPERVRGEPLGPGCDIFALGAILAYAVTGGPPYGTGSPDARNQRVLHLAPRLDDVPGELRPLIERCLAREPADRPTAAQLLAGLGAPLRGDWAAPGGQVPPGKADAPHGKRRRRAWLAGAIATLAVLGTAIGLLVASSPATRPSPAATHSPAAAAPVATPARPTGLVALTQTVSSIEIQWQGGAGGPEPGSFEIQVDGKEVTSVPGGTKSFNLTGLNPGTAYRFSVVSVTDAGRSAPSSTITVSTYVSSPPLVADAPLNWDGLISALETASSDRYFEPVGKTMDDDWSLGSNCLAKPCTTMLDGDLDGWQFIATLSRHGAVYSGSTTVDGDWPCGGSSDRQTGTLQITLTGTTAGIPFTLGQLVITSFTGTMTFDFPAQQGCAASTYQMRFSGT